MSRGLVLLCAACTSPLGPGRPAVPAPARPSEPTGLVTTGHPVTVLDRGSGAELCLGGVAESYPPQCGGPKLAGWDWSEWTGKYEEASGTRWGLFILTGTYDPAAEVFTPADVRTGDGYVWPSSDHDFGSACPEPAGGWRVTDTTKVSSRDLDAALSLAASLPDYSTAWVDQSPNPAVGEKLPPEEVEQRMNDPLYTVINIAVTGDVAVAEAKIRAVWSGMLCVSRAERTEAELLAIQEQLADVRGLLSSYPDARAGVVRADVIFDDGSLQRSLDTRFGQDLVVVNSALKPV